MVILLSLLALLGPTALHFFPVSLLPFAQSNQTVPVLRPMLDLEMASGDVEFHTKSDRGSLQIIGESKDIPPRGILDLGKQMIRGTLEFDMKSIRTGNPLRDKELHERYLETQAFPLAKLKLQPLKLPHPLESGKKIKTDFTGLLTLKKKTLPVLGHFEAKQEKNWVTVFAQFKIQLDDFDIDQPGFLGITLSKEIHVFVDFTAPLVLRKVKTEKTHSEGTQHEGPHPKS